MKSHLTLPVELLPRIERLVEKRAKAAFETEDEARVAIHRAIIRKGIAALEQEAEVT